MSNQELDLTYNLERFKKYFQYHQFGHVSVVGISITLCSLSHNSVSSCINVKNLRCRTSAKICTNFSLLKLTIFKKATTMKQY